MAAPWPPSPAGIPLRKSAGSVAYLASGNFAARIGTVVPIHLSDNENFVRKIFAKARANVDHGVPCFVKQRGMSSMLQAK
jgi:hypothetical protein